LAFPIIHPAIRAATPADLQQIKSDYDTAKRLVDKWHDLPYSDSTHAQAIADMDIAQRDISAASALDADVGPTKWHDDIAIVWSREEGGRYHTALDDEMTKYQDEQNSPGAQYARHSNCVSSQQAEGFTGLSCD
jgi:hypothetical protein